MNAFKRNAGRIMLGVSVAAGAVYATAGGMQEAKAAEVKPTVQPYLYGWDSSTGPGIYRKINVYNDGNCVVGPETCLATSANDLGDTVDDASELAQLDFSNSPESTQYLFE